MRTNDVLVKAVLQNDYGKKPDSTYPSLVPYIRAANLIVTRVNTCATAKGYTLSTAELKELETWLAAHAYQQSDKGYTSRSTADASGSFQGTFGMGLQNTNYGQMALSIDPSGCLMLLGKRKPDAAWLGKSPTDQIAYEDRD